MRYMGEGEQAATHPTNLTYLHPPSLWPSSQRPPALESHSKLTVGSRTSVAGST